MIAKRLKFKNTLIDLASKLSDISKLPDDTEIVTDESDFIEDNRNPIGTNVVYSLNNQIHEDIDEAVTINSIEVEGKELTISDKGVNITKNDIGYEIDSSYDEETCTLDISLI